MRTPPAASRRNDFGSMTPMIDVVFLLLIFFVVTASSQTREMLLPTELAAGAVDANVVPPEPEPLSVEVWLSLKVDAALGGTVVDMNGTPYTDLDQLKAQLRLLAELGPENPVILDIAGNVPLGDVVDVYDTCQSAGFQSVSFAAGE